jgi:hypothetical protein
MRAVTVLGCVSVVLGSLGVVLTPILLQTAESYATLFVVLYGTLSALLVVIGIGQVKHRAWARRAAVGWALGALVWLGALVVAWAIVVGLAKTGGVDDEAGMLPYLLLLLAPYPVLTLRRMRSPLVKAVMNR